MIARNLMTAGLVGLATISGLAVSTMLPGPLATLPIPLSLGNGPDARLAERVSELLRRDGGLIGNDVGVAAESGIVTVSGRLSDESAVRRVMELASGVPGVREVRNAMSAMRDERGRSQ